MGGVLLVYFNLIRAKWPFALVAAIGGVDAVISIALPLKHPLVLPPGVALLVAVVALTIAQFLVWRDTYAVPVSPEHGQVLREMASRFLADLVIPDGVRGAAFRAHFADAIRQGDEIRRRINAEAHCTRRFGEVLVASARERFPGDDWFTGTLIQNADWWFTHGDGFNKIASMLPLDAVPIKSGLIEETHLTWSGNVLKMNSSNPPADLEAVREWLTDLGKLKEAREVREAMAEVSRARNRLAESLEPVVLHAPLDKARRCPICWPVPTASPTG